ncbi:MAG TPA: membrane protein insertase YidC [Planctomycetaceae bacterium]|nr:membrane protein insertase YidC [Planctomycetaceae bacterium]
MATTMEQQRRLMLFFTISLAILLGWSQFVVPVFFPPPPKAAPIAGNDGDDIGPFDLPVSALFPANVGREAIAAAVEPKGPAIVEHPAQTVELGSLDPDSPFFMQVKLTSRGGAIEAIRLNDIRYPEFGERGTPLTLVGHDPLTEEKTFATQLAAFDDQLNGRTLEELHWEVVANSVTDSAATFRIVSPDRRVELTKRYEILKLTPEQVKQPELRDSLAEGYQVALSLGVKNLSPTPLNDLAYALRGPVGLPLEDPLNSHKFRDIRMGFLRTDGGVDTSTFTAQTAVEQEQNQAIEVWKRPIQFLGVDTQYFAALVHPVGDQLKSPVIGESQADVVTAGKEPQFADVSVLLTSTPRTLAPAGAADESDRFTDQYVLFAGPKREELLASMKAEAVLDYGWFAALVRLMLGILEGLRSAGLSYGLAIIGLTCVVRALMFPLTRYQARSMDKMKELQPKIKVLHEKYKKNPESLSPDEMRQMRDVNLKVFSGCLPLLFQMPIFIALYRALQMSVDLRMAPFHFSGKWIDNLASPDAMFAFGFTLPLVGWSEFNLLPWLSIVLMLVNQKFTMPPPADEEQAMQYKMMNVMMLVMVVMFYRVPSGLCLYFIASSIWGTAERLLLKKYAPQTATTTPKTIDSTATVTATTTAPAPAAKPSMLDDFKAKLRELQELADKDSSLSRGSNEPPKSKKQRGRR